MHQIHQIKEQTLLYLSISLIEVEHPLKTTNKKTHCFTYLFLSLK